MIVECIPLVAYHQRRQQIYTLSVESYSPTFGRDEGAAR